MKMLTESYFLMQKARLAEIQMHFYLLLALQEKKSVARNIANKFTNDSAQ
jgi:hypothetical protein